MRSRRDAGGERAAQLALGDDIGAGAEPGEQPQHGEVRVGLDRIADQRRARAAKASAKRRYWARERRRRIDIERRADRRGDPRDRHVLGVQLAAAIGKELTHAGRAADRCWARRAAGSAGPSCRSRPMQRQSKTRARIASGSRASRERGAAGIARRHSRNRLRAAATAARTCSGAVPPKLVRLATERSASSTS